MFYAQGHGQAFSRLQALEIWDATVQVRDAVNEAEFDLEKTDFIVTRKPYGLVASSKILLPSSVRDAPVVGVYADIAIPRSGETVKADILVSDVSVGFFAEFAGDEAAAILREQMGALQMRADVQLDGNFVPQFFDGLVVSPAGVLHVPDFYPDGLAYKDLSVQARYDHESKTILVEDTALDLGGVPVALGADLAWNDGELTGPVRVDIDRLSHGQLKDLWPVNLVEDNSYEWAVKKITGAAFRDVFTQFYLRADAQKGAADVESLMAGFGFSGATVNYRAPLKPVTQASGSTVFNLDSRLGQMWRWIWRRCRGRQIWICMWFCRC